MADINAAQPAAERQLLATVGGLVLVVSGAALLLQVPVLGDIGKEVIRDPRTRMAVRQAASSIGCSILESLLDQIRTLAPEASTQSAP
jgi:hypothetical protein